MDLECQIDGLYKTKSTKANKKCITCQVLHILFPVARLCLSLTDLIVDNLHILLQQTHGAIMYLRQHTHVYMASRKAPFGQLRSPKEFRFA